MTDPIRLPEEVENFIEEKSRGDRSVALAMKALVSAAHDTGEVPFNDVAIQYRNEHLAMVREAGGDADHEAGRLSLDEVRVHLAKTVLPKLVNEGLIMLPPGGLTSPDAPIRIVDRYWQALGPFRAQIRVRTLGRCSVTSTSRPRYGGPERIPPSRRSRRRAFSRRSVSSSRIGDARL